MNPNALSKLIGPLLRKVQLMVGRCVINLVDDALKMQGVQISLLSDETRDKVERLQNYGFTSVPLPGAEGIALAVGGSRNHAVVIAVDDRRHRKIGMQPGESALYTDEGDYVILKRGRIVEVKAGTEVLMTTPLVNTTGVYQVAGIQVVGAQGGAVADPAGGGTIDAQARAQLSALLARVRAHGLIAT
jgi:phage baseplate assembly protein V